ncbi:complex I assembly factor TIMMDC1, mitochondrial isoform X1 [Lepisosteus oculatus]|uniref:complex I assembly factor TIMMDC1, mitochondrial isoform X1 n=2 Tax=Lepisosteus oculatus TaxID=7918 RepID=UPI0035F5283D
MPLSCKGADWGCCGAMDRQGLPASMSACPRLDKPPRGSSYSTLFWGLVPFPRVLAADGVGSGAPAENAVQLPRYISKPELPDTGWDRIKELFDRSEMQAYPEEILNIVKSGLTAAVVGMVYGGIPAARQAREHFIQQSQAEVYRHQVEAVRSAHNAAIRGFIRFGWRWSWRVAAFVTLFSTVSTGLSVYRDKNSLSHYSAAGAITGGLFRLNMGLSGMLACSAIGAVLGVPAGALMMAVQRLTGETHRERKRRERRELYELKLAEWNARLNVTEGLIDEMSKVEDGSIETDLDRIEELLNLPRNEEASASK